MSSIAYLSDEKMIEFHRSNGNRRINFWRLSTKNFDRFDVGSLLFFIDKRYIHPSTKEKGIIGYGRARDIRTMSVKRTWTEYESLNGFKDYESFEATIKAAAKDDVLPKQIQSIELDHVVFFKSPLYLSEVNFDLPQRLESFIYLLDEGRDVALDLLMKADDLGIDQWFVAMNASIEMDIIYEDIREQTIRNALSKVSVEWTQLQENLTFSIKHASRVGPLAYDYSERVTKVYLPCSSLKNQFYEIVGMATWIKKELEGVNLEFYVVLKNQVDDFTQRLNLMNLKPLYI
ncbi:hypothetical protein G7062_01810 [Erysipelothrix sp. HDW6C]|uniref:hypothetical protein n=1 Tax=Erysipelothrix sp. HDW6C TaxID=2714930 RepID=UPI001407DBC3|nr:hypothetical protein [Erysipelothrix sp. HDW6C]QIK69092.1 hypothetical protein G7062_01810 [Erysipelothrix sp. HDW6C]